MSEEFTTPPPRRWLTIDEAAAYLRCHRNTIYGHFRAGRLTKYKIGAKSVRVDFNEVESLVQAGAR